MVTLAPQSSASFTNQIRLGLERLPWRYWRTVLEVTPMRLLTSPMERPLREMSVSSSRAMARSSQTRGVMGLDERKVGIDEEDGTIWGEPTLTWGADSFEGAARELIERIIASVDMQSQCQRGVSPGDVIRGSGSGSHMLRPLLRRPGALSGPTPAGGARWWGGIS